MTHPPSLVEQMHAHMPIERNTHEILASMAMLLEEQLAVQRHLLAALGSSSDSRSSIEVKTSTRGVDVSVKAYEGSPMDGLSDQAVSEYFTTLDKVQARLMAGEKP